MLISVKSRKPLDTLCSEARELGISTLPIAAFTETPEKSTTTLIFYYNQIPLEKIEPALKGLIKKWQTNVRG